MLSLVYNCILNIFALVDDAIDTCRNIICIWHLLRSHWSLTQFTPALVFDAVHTCFGAAIEHLLPALVFDTVYSCTTLSLVYDTVHSCLLSFSMHWSMTQFTPALVYDTVHTCFFRISRATQLDIWMIRLFHSVCYAMFLRKLEPIAGAAFAIVLSFASVLLFATGKAALTDLTDALLQRLLPVSRPL